MQLGVDRTGFPLLRLPLTGIEMHALPITKVQFERFLADPNEYGDSWYEAVLAVNPRVAPYAFSAENRERLLLTGILPFEVEAFCAWLGEGFRVPTAEEWRAAYNELGSIPREAVAGLQDLPAIAAGILHRLAAQIPTGSAREFALLAGGVVEWVRRGDSWLGLGAPRYQFHRNAWNPLFNEVRPIRAGDRLPFFGFRLVRGGGAG
ncbi:MAG TPA: SUMF1/EgtB/PvdO family nonheme iron enzyme [Chloroflexota bacterium]|nr:SUMF1/EgtB/PvdO family nonheme iron enzyme [Chloroflexota bacterium]